MAKHLSIFVENRPGKLDGITGVFAQNAIDIRAFSIASAGEFGVLKTLVNAPDKAYALLKAGGHTVSLRDIVVAIVDDAPGSLRRLLAALGQAGVNIDDSYGFLLEKGKSAAVALEVDAPAKAEAALRQGGFTVLSDAEVYAL